MVLCSNFILPTLQGICNTTRENFFSFFALHPGGRFFVSLAEKAKKQAVFPTFGNLDALE